MSLTFHDRVYLTPLTKRRKRAPDSPPDAHQDHDIGRSPPLLPRWWLAGTALLYVAVALILIFGH